MTPQLNHKYEMHFDISQKTFHSPDSIVSQIHSPQENIKILTLQFSIMPKHAVALC
jgi:hypothetical protein